MSGDFLTGVRPRLWMSMCTYHDDPLELIRLDVPVSVRIKVMKGLAEALALVALDELGELVIFVAAARQGDSGAWRSA